MKNTSDKFSFQVVRGLTALRHGLILTSAIILAACTHSNGMGETVETEVQPAGVQSQRMEQVSVDAQSSTDVSQISVASSDYAAKQISRNVDTPQLTVDQLKDYADRCAPGKITTDANIDCSELSLRIRKVFKTDDKVADALITLNRLGRTSNSDTVEDEFGQKNRNLSLSAQAIAGGALDVPNANIPEQPVISDEFESFLNEIGLGVNAGAIVQSGGG